MRVRSFSRPARVAKVTAAIVSVVTAGALLMQCKTPSPTRSGLKGDETSSASAAVGSLPVTLAALGHGLYRVDANLGNAPEGWTHVKYRVVRARATDAVDCTSTGMREMKRSDFKNDRLELTLDNLKDEVLDALELRNDPLNRAKLDQASMDVVGQGELAIEGCVFRDGSEVLKGRSFAESGPGKGFGLAEGDYTILNHGAECEQKLGPIPEFSCLDKSFSMDLPITVNGEPAGNLTGDTSDKCDKPVLLGGMKSQCLKHSRIGRLPKQPGFEMVDTVFICRRYSKASGTTDPNFSDVAIVQSRRDTGATCWFQMLAGTKPPRDATKVPSPTDATPVAPGATKSRAEDFWLPPQNTANIECFTCHDSDPFMHSPYVDQAVFGQGTIYPGQPVVPRVAPSNMDHKYFAVGSDPSGFATTRWKELVTVKPKVSEGMDATCTSCHRVGTHETCQRWVGDSVGKTLTFGQYRTAWSLKSGNAHVKYWMPQFTNVIESTPGKPHNLTEQKWLADYSAAVDALQYCCSNPGDTTKCERTRVPGGGGAEPPPPTGETVKVTIKIDTEKQIPGGFSLAVPPEPILVAFGNNVLEAGIVTDINLKVTVMHSNANDLEIRLVSPGNKNAIAKNYSFDTEGGGTQTTTKTFTSSDTSLASLLNSSARGKWKLDVWDPLPQNEGKLVSAELTLTVRIDQAVAGN